MPLRSIGMPYLRPASIHENQIFSTAIGMRINSAEGLWNFEPTYCAPRPYGLELQIWLGMPVCQFQFHWYPEQTFHPLCFRLSVPAAGTRPLMLHFWTVRPFPWLWICQTLGVSCVYLRSLSPQSALPPVLNSLKPDNILNRSQCATLAGYGIIWDTFKSLVFCPSIIHASLSIILSTLNAPFHFLLCPLYTLTIFLGVGRTYWLV